MKRPATCYEPAMIAGFLGGDLSTDDESAFVEHLDSCDRCRQMLEDSAGGQSWLTEVQSSLSSDEIDSVVKLATPRPHEPLRQETAAQAHRALAEQALAALQCCMAPTDDPRMIGRIGGYEISGVIGRGAAGIVVKAFQPALNRFVAIKLLAPEVAVNAAARLRFEREAQAAAAVVHEHVVPIYAVDEFRGTPFLVMQYVSGGSLEKRLAEEGILPPAAALRIGLQIASGLSAAHAQGLIHRDIKPANILLESGLDRVLITDFGLARAVDDATLTHSGFAAGTPQFMSPEQARGEGIDHRTDLFSLGSVLYTLLAGRPPFRAETAYGLLKRICENPHRRLIEVNPAVPVWLSGLVDRLLAKEPDARFADAAEVASLLSTCLAHLQNPTTCELPREVRQMGAMTRRGKRSLLRRVMIGGSFLACLIAIIAATWPSRTGLVSGVGIQPPQQNPLPASASVSSTIQPEKTAAQQEQTPRDHQDTNDASIAQVPKEQAADESRVDPSVNLDQSIKELRQAVMQVESRWFSRSPPLPDPWQQRWQEAAKSAAKLSQAEEFGRASAKGATLPNASVPSRPQ